MLKQKKGHKNQTVDQVSSRKLGQVCMHTGTVFLLAILTRMLRNHLCLFLKQKLGYRADGKVPNTSRRLSQ